MRWGDQPYHALSWQLKHDFGEKVYKLSLDGGMTCPNRDGTLGSRGCIFCSAGGSGDFAADRSLSVSAQITQQKMLPKMRDIHRFIAYFQAYTNTYAPTSYLRRIFTEAITHPEVAALSIGTRPDCLPEDTLDLLGELNRQKPVWVELGLQTIHPQTAQFIRRGYDLPVFAKAVKQLRERGITVIVHVILGLPGEDRDKMLETIDYLSHMDIQGIKLQLLHVLRHTDLAALYLEHPFPILTQADYIDLVIDCVEHLRPDITIHRLTGDGPKALLIEPIWSTNKRNVLNALHARMKERGSYQGKCYII